jgi:enoyl-CoA hydratase/carnithine racemase
VPVRVEDHDHGVRVVLLDRPEKRNAIDREMVGAIQEALETTRGAVMVLGSTHSSAFSSGADLDLLPDERAEVSERLYALYEAMQGSSVVLIAAASGHAVGGGAQLLIACDLRVVAPDTTIRFMGPGHGLAVGAWGLPSLVGRGRAMDLCLSMRPVDSEEALQIGLVDRVVENPLREANDYAYRIAQLDRDALATIKMVIGTADRAESLRIERDHNAGWDGSIPGSKPGGK